MKKKQPIPELVKRRQVDIHGYTLADACYLCMYHNRMGYRHFCMKHEKFISELCVCPISELCQKDTCEDCKTKEVLKRTAKEPVCPACGKPYDNK